MNDNTLFGFSILAYLFLLVGYHEYKRKKALRAGHPHFHGERRTYLRSRN